ncbi:hypothetical protein N0V84_006441 [Fusarium piperis]|uniref:Uncharacterized protein n=1 Tax=Fusarium piperis TaxID=1435070 RepID=A0A9W8WBS5_9HYPO|nr:hypothetical protein N0V84_006441 [Fusarium piperis]
MQDKKCASAVINIIVACDPALCLICGFHKQDEYYEIECRIKSMSRAKGLLGEIRVPFFWGLDPAMAWEGFESNEKRRIAYGVQ